MGRYFPSNRHSSFEKRDTMKTLINKGGRFTSVCSHKFPMRFESSNNDSEDLLIYITRLKKAEGIATFLDKHLIYWK